MKKLLFVIAIGALTNVAHAQSTVTLYGIVDEGINYNSNSGGHPLFNMSSGVLSGSRFGLRGSEDLGGGLKALFNVEGGFDATSGKSSQGGLLFGRQAYVGLSNTRWGSATLGRQYDALVDFVGVLGAADQWGGYIVAHAGDIDNFNNAFRSNNTVKLSSANFGGLSFGGTYSFGGVAGQFTQNQIWSLGAGYNRGPLVLGVGYLNARTPSNAGGLMGNNTTTSTASVVSNPIYAGFLSANTYQVAGAGAAYRFGAATVGATYSNIKFMNLGANGNSSFRAGETATFNNAELNFKYQVTPALLLGAAFDYTKGSSVARVNRVENPGSDYYQGALAADYFLSKRTDVYVVGVYQKASGTNSRNQNAVAAINSLTASDSDRATNVRVGIRHKF